MDDMRLCTDCRNLKGGRCVSEDGVWYPISVPKEIGPRYLRCLGFVDIVTKEKGKDLWPSLQQTELKPKSTSGRTRA